MSVAVSLRARCVIAHHLGVSFGQVVDGANLRDDLQADSLDIAALANRLEEEFDIIISDDESEDCDTVERAIALIEQKVAEKQSPSETEELTHG